MPKQTVLRRLGFAAIIVAAAVWLSLDFVGNVAFRRGLQAKSEWRLAEAVNYFAWARRLQRSDRIATLELGLCHQLRGDFLSSQKEFDALLRTKIEDKTTLSRLHNATGVNHYSFGEPDAAARSHKEALELARSAGNRRLEAEALIDLSRVFYHSQGKVDDALSKLQQANSIAREISDERIEAAALRNIGTVYWWFKGELDRPLKEFYFPALELYRRQNDQRGAATMLTIIALVFNSKGDIYRFMQYQNESIEIQERIGDEAGLTDSFMAMGDLYSGIGNYRKALEFFRKSLAITERTGYRLAQIDLEAYLAHVNVNLDEYDEAIKLYDPSFKHKSKESVLHNYALNSVAYCYQLKGDYAQALSLYERAMQVHKQAGLADVRFETNTLLRSAECFVALGDWQRASEFMTRADEILQKADTHSEGEIQPATVRAKIAQHEGRHEAALKHLQDALETETRIFAAASTNFLIPPHRRSYEGLYNVLLDYSISHPDPKISKKADELLFRFHENMRYRSLRNFLVRVKERRADAPQKSEKERELTGRIDSLSRKLKQHSDASTREQLRQFYDQYENLTLKTQLEQPQYLAIRAAQPADLSEIQQNLQSQTALVEFLFAGEKVLALVVTQESLEIVVLPVSQRTLAAKTKLFRSLIFTNEATDTAWLPVAESLRTILIEPLEKSGALKEIERIGFVPYAFLHDLPFAALVRRENENIKFLVEDYTLFQIPSMTFYASKNKSLPPRPSSADGSALLNYRLTPESSGGPDSQQSVTIAFGRNQSSEAKLPDLEFAAEEAQTVAQATRGTAFINKQATETEIKRLAYNCDYLHLSTHAIAESDMPLFSRLLLEPTNTDDGNLTVREIFELGLRTRLVTLSACETGQSFSASGNEFIEQDRIGLIEAFLHAGANSVLATLLPVSDRATTEFMKAFYQRLSSTDKATALAETQRAIIRGEVSYAADSRQLEMRHPRYWAPFILVGDSH